MSTIVYLGNRDAVEVVPDPDPEVQAAAAAAGEPEPKIRRPAPGKRCTTITLPDEYSLSAQFQVITAPTGLWHQMSDADAPAWVASTSPTLATLLAAHWGGVEIRDPDPTDGGTADVTA